MDKNTTNQNREYIPGISYVWDHSEILYQPLVYIFNTS